MSDIEKLKKFFETFRKLEMKIWYDGDCVKMQIPCRFDAGFMLVIRARYVYKNGKQMVCMSDDGCIVKNNKISFADIRTLCERYHLEYSIIGDKEAIPLDCEIYKVVDEKDFCDVIWYIMELGSAAHRLGSDAGILGHSYCCPSEEAHICQQEKTSNKDKVPEKREQKNEPSKIVHKLTITVDKET